MKIVVAFALIACVLAVSAQDYDQDKALEMVYYSSAAYCDEVVDKDHWDCKVCQEQLPNFQLMYTLDNDDTSTFGFAGIDPVKQEIIFAFEGSDDLTDWIYNLQFSKLGPYGDHPEAKVHTGFYKVYQSVEDKVLVAFDELEALYPTWPIYVTGHSLGAALATLCSLDLARARNYSVNLVTFGAPRIGNPAFAGLVDASVGHWRLTHRHDIVVHLPTKFMGFWHAATEVWYPEQTGLEHTVCVGDEDPNCADSVTIALNSDDHRNYLDVWLTQQC